MMDTLPPDNSHKTHVSIVADNSNCNSNHSCIFYVNEIRNMKLLSNDMLNNIRDMSHEEKMNIIIAFNDILENLQVLLE
jgi:hypothetical protein